MIATTTITLFNNSTTYDLTTRTYGATCNTECAPGIFGRASASFDFYNNDGAMTPGGGGTYSSVDWFSMAIKITFSTSQGSGTSFAGIITDFQLLDDGRNSYVRISAVDAFTIGGSTATSVATGAVTVGGTVTSWINNFFNGNSTYITSVGMPKLGASSATASGTDVGQSSVGLAATSWSATGRASDFVNNTVMPAGPNFAWPTDISTGASVTYNYNAANLYPLRSTIALKFTFAQNPSGAASELPILDLVREFNTDDLLNDSSVTTVPTITTGVVYSTTQSNATSQGSYGTRTISLTSMLGGAVSGGTTPQAPGTANSSAGTVAQRWAWTYSDVDFVTISLVVTDSSLTGNGTTSTGSIAAYRDLLNASTALLQPSLVQYTPTGAASETTDTLITIGREIQFTTSDIRIKVKFMVADRSAFILDNTYFGVLTTNRLG
jgi:hypothetical protein